MSKLKIKNGNTWEEVPAGGVGVPPGGTAGQVMMKSSDADYATEWGNIGTFTSGTNGIWTYRKYSDGTYHAWCDSAVNLAAGSAFAGGYYHLSASALTPPSFSTGVTSLSGAARGAMLAAYLGYSTSTYQTYWLTGAAAAANNYPVHLDMYGTW